VIFDKNHSRRVYYFKRFETVGGDILWYLPPRYAIVLSLRLSLRAGRDGRFLQALIFLGVERIS